MRACFSCLGKCYPAWRIQAVRAGLAPCAGFSIFLAGLRNELLSRPGLIECACCPRAINNLSIVGSYQVLFERNARACIYGPLPPSPPPRKGAVLRARRPSPLPSPHAGPSRSHHSYSFRVSLAP